MSRWFRFYADAMRNPKVARLSDGDFRLWVKLLAVASENDGKIPPTDDLKILLSTRLDHLLAGLKRLISGGLIDLLADGYEPHNWNKFQYKSDTSNERVAKHRAKRNVTVTPPETEADTEQKEERSNDLSARERAQAVLAEWNGMAKATGLPLATKLDAKRIASITARLADNAPDRMTEAIRKIGASTFCRGSNFAGLDWLMKPANFLKVIEGNYDDRPNRPQPPANLFRNAQQRPVDGFQSAIASDLADIGRRRDAAHDQGGAGDGDAEPSGRPSLRLAFSGPGFT